MSGRPRGANLSHESSNRLPSLARQHIGADTTTAAINNPPITISHPKVPSAREFQVHHRRLKWCVRAACFTASLEIAPSASLSLPRSGERPTRSYLASASGKFAAEHHHVPVLAIEDHGSRRGSAAPFCRISIEMLSGELTKAMRPSRGGRLIVRPASPKR